MVCGCLEVILKEGGTAHISELERLIQVWWGETNNLFLQDNLQGTDSYVWSSIGVYCNVCVSKSYSLLGLPVQHRWVANVCALWSASARLLFGWVSTPTRTYHNQRESIHFFRQLVRTGDELFTASMVANTTAVEGQSHLAPRLSSGCPGWQGVTVKMR